MVEIGNLTAIKLDEQGLPTKPNLKTVQINLISVLHSTPLFLLIALAATINVPSSLSAGLSLFEKEREQRVTQSSRPNRLYGCVRELALRL